MELQQESSNLAALSTTTSRHFSSSSSAFVSATQSPFFSPRSPQAYIPEQPINPCISLTINNKEPIEKLKYSPSDVSPSSNFAATVTILRDTAEALGSSSNYSQERKGKAKKSGRNQGNFSYSKPSPSVSTSARVRSCDVFIGFHGRKPSLLRFVNWLRAELELQGISSFSADRAQCRNSRSHESVHRVMNACLYGIVIITKKSFGNPYTIEELHKFLGKKNLCPIFFDLSVCDCLARDIVERRGELWEKHGGELWMQYDGQEKEWRDAVDGLCRTLDWQVEANDGNWRECVSNMVILLATRLGRRNVIETVNRWRERVEKEELPFQRNEEFVGRKKELSELELILFGDVSGDGEREYVEIKTRQRRKNLLIGRHRNSESSSRGKDPVVWKESEKEIEMQQIRPIRSRTSYGRRKRNTRMLYGKGIACVSGDSGIGKTELVLEYAYRFSQRYKMVLWIGGESKYIRQNYLNLRSFLEVDLSIEHHSIEKGKVKCFEEQEEDAIAKIRKELMRDIPYLVVIDNLESEKDWWDKKSIMDLLPRFGGETHFIITTRLPKLLNIEPMKLSYLSGMEALSLMKGGVKDYPALEIDALRVIEEKLGRLTFGLGVVGAILSELPITPSRLLDTINRMPLRGSSSNSFLTKLLDVCLSIFDHADGPRSLATRMVQVSGWFAPGPVPIPLLALTAHKIPRKHTESSMVIMKFLSFFSSSRMKRSEAEASSMLIRFGIARSSTKPDCIHFHEIVKLYAMKRGSNRVAQAFFEAVCVRGSITQYPEQLWASCFLLFGFSKGLGTMDPNPSELLLFVKRIVLPLAVQAFIMFSRCNAALELLRVCTDALELCAESMVSRAEKWTDRSFCCLGPAKHDAQYTYLFQELALMRANVLETRVKLMIKGGMYDVGDDLIRKSIFIRSSICGEDHPDTVSARETLGKVTRLLTNVQS